ncbi:hypothetical protein K505DRAFT_42733 [Melanomma pulvis-pyrius CBS 109.77]|uniref:Uncharacterized protein n=1 Tax=Melanomma pulvis-pyrius CBS 109.77 TaxID=1314802 RepID=A0A6A6XA23_9PLEO|nr:hypothetical protein K505DRAFT_42733 [Melanomma pulvis-pyrius CBS 109.77]
MDYVVVIALHMFFTCPTNEAISYTVRYSKMRRRTSVIQKNIVQRWVSSSLCKRMWAAPKRGVISKRSQTSQIGVGEGIVRYGVGFDLSIHRLFPRLGNCVHTPYVTSVMMMLPVFVPGLVLKVQDVALLVKKS